MAIFAEPRLAQLALPATEMLEERSKMESTAPSTAPAAMTVLGVEMVVKNTFLEVAEEEEVAAKLQRCSSAPGSLAAWSQRCLSDGHEDGRIESELPAASHSWSGHATHRVADDRRAAGKVSSDAILKKCVPRGDYVDESPSSATCTPSSTMSSWTTDIEDYDYELAQFETPRRLSIASFAMEGYEDELAQFEAPRRCTFSGFFMDTPVRAGGAGAPPAAAAADAHAGGAAPQAPPQQAPQVVTTLMVQNLDRSLTRRGFMNSLDKQGFAGKYDFVHLPKSFGTRRNNGFAFVNFMKLEDADEFARSIARINGSKVRAVPAAVQGSANAAKASSRKMTRIRDSGSRPLVVNGHGQDAPMQA